MDKGLHLLSRSPTMPQEPGHILFVTGEYPPMIGGVGAYTAELGAALVERGWRVSVLTSVDAKPSMAERASSESPITVYPIMQQWGFGLWQKAADVARQAGVDLIHVQYQAGAFDLHPAVNLAPLWWRQQGFAVAWTYHDLLLPYIFPKAYPLRTWARDLPARVCDRVIATNDGDLAHFAQFTGKLISIPIGSNVRAHFLTPAERRARRALRGYGEDDLVVGYFGFVNPSKGGLNLIKTLERLRDDEPTAQLLMIGEQVHAGSPDDKMYWEEVQQYMHAQGLADRVTVTGFQPDPEVSADLAACDVLFLPYLDGASLRRGTLMAGLAHGCAIVTTAPTLPTPQLVDGRDVLFVPQGELEAAAAAIRRVAHDPVLRAKLRQNALATSKIFSWETIAEAHERFFLSA